jgi:hypothetical protein
MDQKKEGEQMLKDQEGLKRVSPITQPGKKQMARGRMVHMTQ